MAKGETIGEFLIGLGIDPSGIDKGLNKAVSGIQGSLKGLVSKIALPVFAAFTSGDFLTKMIGDTANTAKLSNALGMDIGTLDAWQQSAELAGMEASQMGETFKGLNDNIMAVATTGRGPMNAMIKNGLVPDIRDANGNVKKASDYIFELADSMKMLADSGRKQEAMGIMSRLGISDVKMQGFIMQGRAALQQTIQQRKEAGTLTDEDKKLATVMGDVNKLNKDLYVQLRNYLRPIMRVVLTLYSRMVGVLKQVMKHIRVFIPLIIAYAAKLGIARLAALNFFKAFTVARFARMGAAIKSFMLNPFNMFLILLVLAGLALDDFLTWMEGGESQFGNFWTKIFGSPEEAQKWWDGVKEGAKNVLDALSSLQGPILKIAAALAALGAIGTVFGGIYSLLAPLAPVFMLIGKAILFVVTKLNIWMVVITLIIAFIMLLAEHWDELGARIGEIIDGVKEAFGEFANDCENAWERIKQGASDMINSIVSFFSNLVSSASDVVSDIIKFFSDGWDSIVSGAKDFVNNILDKFTPITDKISSIKNSVSNYYDNSTSNNYGLFSPTPDPSALF